jgi:MFS family permease
MSQARPRRRVGPAIVRGPFALLWAGQTISLLGDGVFTVSFTWQIAVQWQRPELLGALFGTRVLAELAALGLGGWIVDRTPRRAIMLASDALRCLLLVGLAITLRQPAPIAPLAMLLAAYGIATGLFRPALLSYIPEIIERDRLAAANALFTISQQAALILGPALGGILLGVGSAPTALRLDGLTFLVAALAILPLPARPAAATPAAGGAFAEAAEGFRAVRRVAWVGGTILLFSLTNIATITAERLALPRAAQEHYGQLGGYTTILVALGTGAIIAALVTGPSRPQREAGRLAYSAIGLFGLATAGFGIAHGVAAAVVIGLVFGFGQTVAELLWTTSLQRNTPDQLLGRVNAADHFGSFLFLPLSFAFGGLLVQAVSPQWVLIGAGAAAMIAAVIGLALPSLHRWQPFTVDTATGLVGPVASDADGRRPSSGKAFGPNPADPDTSHSGRAGSALPFAPRPEDEAMLVASALARWNSNWLQWLSEQLDRHGNDPQAHLNSLFDALGDWFVSERFHGSPVATAAAILHDKPDHPAHRVIEGHRLAVRQLLEDLAKATDCKAPSELAAQVQVLIDGAIAIAADQPSRDPAEQAHRLAVAVMTAATPKC